MIEKKWTVREPDSTVVRELADHCGLSDIVATVMVNRGVSDLKSAQAFLSPSLAAMHDPLLMADMNQAVSRLITAHQRGELVCIYGDYDVDGVSATALLVSGFTALGLQVTYHIPSRMDDGYGLNSEALQAVKSRAAAVVVSVDCGVTALEEAARCREIGIDLIITDHHQPLDELPDAVAVINPHRTDCRYPFKGLAGVGVAFNLLVALRSTLREAGLLDGKEPDLRQWLDLVALGTIADLVPLVDQNRMLVTAGLQRMGTGCRVGVQALKKVSGITGGVSSGQVGFQLAPRLNAAGRLETAVPGVELLLTEDPVRAAGLAAELDAANTERRQVERQMFEQAVAMVESSGGVSGRQSIVLSSPDWHQGVVGIVASRMVDRYYRPTILIAELEDGSGKGSGRSISGFHLLDVLHASASGLQRYGGHRAAAGVTVNPGEIAQFADAFEQAAAAQLGNVDPVPELLLDAVLEPDALDMQLALELQKLEPFGMGNQTPVFMLPGMQILEQRRFGEGHLAVRVQRAGKQFRLIGWGMADNQLPAMVDIACTVKLDSWQGRQQLKLEIKDYRHAA